ncbi:Putative steroid membrane receptor Hpr6.6/25-Dx [Ceraceosorus bombacis]|uniref:Putative steroid membrane receptor Hpr6.6/25-Dx n=1 Tax=Ceraceosorus bombacis TaxID=401625 RepID=A0A0P1BE99_9BASI|nr:Putative steroid membrane receptor Hpr6.6/25-Dx [Ceraceosorus bombacis]
MGLFGGAAAKASPSWVDWAIHILQGFSNPLNILLLLVLLYLLYPLLPRPLSHYTPTLSQARQTSSTSTTSLNSNGSYNSLPSKHAPASLWRRYTPRTLAVYDGTGANGEEGETILLAIEGQVFDVTKGANFYGPGGPYGNFAGRDASRGMAKQSFALEMLTPLDQPLDKLDDLTPAEVTNMREWAQHFSNKYFVCGELVNEGEGD